ncbi:LysM peptidoglycan-binding domain-containing protein, partial [Arthrospira platensis SPKY1]|nr:LysM peptidoglycan-binding domain-containing protein [Arthrospira platensis SPKY1]
QPGQKLVIPAAELMKKEVSVETTFDTLFHVIKAKETPFGVAQQYGLSVSDLIKLNPKARESFQIGDRVIVKINPKAVQVVPKTLNQQRVNACYDGALEVYTIEPKETLFSIGKKFNISKEKLLCINPELKDGVKAGQHIWIPEAS